MKRICHQITTWTTKASPLRRWRWNHLTSTTYHLHLVHIVESTIQNVWSNANRRIATNGSAMEKEQMNLEVTFFGIWSNQITKKCRCIRSRIWRILLWSVTYVEARICFYLVSFLPKSSIALFYCAESLVWVKFLKKTTISILRIGCLWLKIKQFRVGWLVSHQPWIFRGVEK